MKNKPDFMIIGGDCRFSYIKTILEKKGYSAKRIYPGEYRADDFDNTDIFILPVPVSRDNININTPLAGENFYFGDFVRLLPEKCIVTGGLFKEEHLQKLKNKNAVVYDYYKNDTLARKNAIPTAEGVIGILINALPVTVDGLKCAVTGYGKCASVISRKLKALGADVTAVARSDKNLSDAEHDGMNTCRLSDFPAVCHGFDTIINTVPSRIIDRNILSKIKKDCVIIEIASAPFGIDFDCATELGINAIKAGSLPGRISPETAGEIICDTVLSYYWSDSNGN